MFTRLSRLGRVIWYLRAKRKEELAGLQLDVTSDCNLRCKTCYFFKDGSHLADNMSIQDIEKLFQQYQDQHIYQAWLYGGEPTLREDIIDLAYRYFPVLTIISNGQIKVSSAYKKAKLHISLDGLEKENDYLRGKGSFQKIVSNYRGDRRAIFNVTITKMNLPTLDEVICYVKSLKTAGIEFQIYSKSSKPTKFDERLGLDEQDIATVRKTLSKYQYDLNVFMTKALLESLLTRRLESACKLNDYIYCYASDGNRKSCCTPGIVCEDCKMLPTHFIETVEKDNDLMTKLKFSLWM